MCNGQSTRELWKSSHICWDIQGTRNLCFVSDLDANVLPLVLLTLFSSANLCCSYFKIRLFYDVVSTSHVMFTLCRAGYGIIIVNYESNVIWRLPISPIFRYLVCLKLAEDSGKRTASFFMVEESIKQANSNRALVATCSEHLPNYKWHHIPAKSTFHNNRCGNLRSHIICSIYLVSYLQTHLLKNRYYWESVSDIDSQ
jgi:hypothetical protein